MHVAQLRFERLPPEPVADEDSSVHGHLTNLRRAGWVCDSDWLISVTGDGCQASVLLPEADALDRALGSYSDAPTEARWHLSLVSCAPMLSADPICRCARPSRHVLFTHYFSPEPPVRCGDCWGYVPLYRLPGADAMDLGPITGWQSDYRSCDHLQLSCTVLERACLRQMGRLDSALTRQGLDCCLQLSEMTGVPAYYYLHKCYGRSRKQERARKCPGCGGEWLLDEPWNKLFDFRCDRCRLLSNIATLLR